MRVHDLDFLTWSACLGWVYKYTFSMRSRIEIVQQAERDIKELHLSDFGNLSVLLNMLFVCSCLRSVLRHFEVSGLEFVSIYYQNIYCVVSVQQIFLILQLKKCIFKTFYYFNVITWLLPDSFGIFIKMWRPMECLFPAIVYTQYRDDFDTYKALYNEIHEPW